MCDVRFSESDNKQESVFSMLYPFHYRLRRSNYTISDMCSLKRRHVALLSSTSIVPSCTRKSENPGGAEKAEPSFASVLAPPTLQVIVEMSGSMKVMTMMMTI